MTPEQLIIGIVLLMMALAIVAYIIMVYNEPRSKP